jgi:hypothetical protein
VVLCCWEVKVLDTRLEVLSLLYRRTFYILNFLCFSISEYMARSFYWGIRFCKGKMKPCSPFYIDSAQKKNFCDKIGAEELKQFSIGITTGILHLYNSILMLSTTPLQFSLYLAAK